MTRTQSRSAVRSAVRNVGEWAPRKTAGPLGGSVSLLRAADYVSGQTWVNTVAVPADGATTAAHSFWLGITASVEPQDPSISAGPPPRWVFTSGCRMTLAQASIDGVPTFYRNMHHAGSKFSFLVRCRWNGSLNSGICPVFDTGCGDFGGSDVSRGVYFMDFGTDGKLRLRVKRDSGGASALAVVSDAAIPANQNVTIGFSVDGTGAQTSFGYIDGAKVAIGGATDFDGTFVTPGTTQTANLPKLMARGDGGSTTNVVQLFGMALYNRNLSLAEMTSEAAALA